MDERVSSENKLLCNLTFEDKNVNFIPAVFFLYLCIFYLTCIQLISQFDSIKHALCIKNLYMCFLGGGGLKMSLQDHKC